MRSMTTNSEPARIDAWVMSALLLFFNSYLSLLNICTSIMELSHWGSVVVTRIRPQFYQLPARTFFFFFLHINALQLSHFSQGHLKFPLVMVGLTPKGQRNFGERCEGKLSE